MDSATLANCPHCGGLCLNENGVLRSMTDHVSAERISVLQERLSDEQINLSAQKAYVKQLKEQLRLSRERTPCRSEEEG